MATAMEAVPMETDDSESECFVDNLFYPTADIDISVSQLKGTTNNPDDIDTSHSKESTSESDDEILGVFSHLFSASPIKDISNSKAATEDSDEELVAGFKNLFCDSPVCETTKAKADTETDNFLAGFSLFDESSEDECDTRVPRANSTQNKNKSTGASQHRPTPLITISTDTVTSSTETHNSPEEFSEQSNATESKDSSKKIESATTEDISIVSMATPSNLRQTALIYRQESEEHNHCVICMDTFTNPKVLEKCSHKFCTECIEQQFRHRPVCPVCFVAYGVITGNQPVDGYMSNSIVKRSLPGYPGCNTISVTYGFLDGVQTGEHPNPGVEYSGTSRTGYLPDNAEGQKVLALLKLAFKRRLVFTVGRSRTTGCDNVVTWNDIHHKTSMSGGMQNFGYPDPTYLLRVQEELAAFGVTAESLKEDK